MVKQLKSYKNKSIKYKKSKIYRKYKFSKKNLKGGMSNNTQLPIGFYWKEYHYGWNKITNLTLLEDGKVSMTTSHNIDRSDNIDHSFINSMTITYENIEDFKIMFNNNDVINENKIKQLEDYCKKKYGTKTYSWYGIGTKKIFYIESNNKITLLLKDFGFTII